MFVDCPGCDKPIARDDVVIRAKVVRPPHGNRQWYGARYLSRCFDCAWEIIKVYETTSSKDLRRFAEHVGAESFLDWLQQGDVDGEDLFFALYRATRCERCERILYLPRFDGRVSQTCGLDCSPPYDPKRRECEVCGAGFEGARSDAKYCSDACKQKAYRMRKAREDRTATEGECAACGGPLHPDRPDARWCSISCAKKVKAGP